LRETDGAIIGDQELRYAIRDSVGNVRGEGGLGGGGGSGDEPEDFVVALGLADLGEEALEEQVVVGLRRALGIDGGSTAAGGRGQRRRQGAATAAGATTAAVGDLGEAVAAAGEGGGGGGAIEGSVSGGSERGK
jgi:hypothetical protein